MVGHLYDHLVRQDTLFDRRGFVFIKIIKGYR